MPTSLFVFCETVPCNRLLVNLPMVTFMLSRLTLKKMYVSWFYNINSICLTSKLSLNMWVWVFGCVLLCFCIPISITSYTHTHTLAGLCSGPSAGLVLPAGPWLWVLEKQFNSPTSVLLLGANLLAVHPHHTLQIASPSHLSQPIINYWWMGRLTVLRWWEERREQASGQVEEVRKA